MDKQRFQNQNIPDDQFDADEYDDMELLELLESVREDMEELGVTTLEEVILRIEELHRKLDTKNM